MMTTDFSKALVPFQSPLFTFFPPLLPRPFKRQIKFLLVIDPERSTFSPADRQFPVSWLPLLRCTFSLFHLLFFFLGFYFEYFVWTRGLLSSYPGVVSFFFLYVDWS